VSRYGTIREDRIKHLDVEPDEAVGFLAFVLGWNGGQLPVFVNGSYVPRGRLFCEPGMGARLYRLARKLELKESAQVEIGLPVTDGGILGSTVLWAWSRSRDSTRRASRFSPAPSIVLRFGASAERLMLWGLCEPVPYALIESQNERLSYALHAPRTHCRAEKLRVPLPGTFLRVGRSRPAPVLVTRMELTDYTRSQVTARLKDAPSRDAWRERRSA
jgi:hypothetical protein